MRALASLTSIALAALAPHAAWACSVCFSASDETRAAFVGTTLFLTLLPLGLIVGGVLWLRRLGVGAAYDRPDEATGEPGRVPPLPAAPQKR